MAPEINNLWRYSFDLALGIEQRGKADSEQGQLNYLINHLSKETEISVVKQGSKIAAFIALSFKDGRCFEIDQLYIHPDFQKQGIGRLLVDMAKEKAGQSLSLYTFQLNKNAQIFYLAMGFKVVAQGYADMQSNPWAKSKEQLADLQFLWANQ